MYLAWEDDFDRWVAAKVLHNLDDSGLRSFDRDRRHLGRLSGHPSIITVHRFGETAAGAPYLLMEYAAGGSLQDLIEAEGALEPSRALDLLEPVGAALDYGHDQGILHRDVKPANILLTDQGYTKLTDYGIAALREASTPQTIAFTLAHTPPETFSSGFDARSEQSDVYSLASSFYTLVGGRSPFEVDGPDSQAAFMKRIETFPIEPLAILSARENAALAQAMAKDPTSRPTSAEAFLRSLDGDHRSVGSKPSGDTTVRAPDVRPGPNSKGPPDDPPVDLYQPPISEGLSASPPAHESVTLRELAHPEPRFSQPRPGGNRVRHRLSRLSLVVGLLAAGAGGLWIASRSDTNEALGSSTNAAPVVVATTSTDLVDADAEDPEGPSASTSVSSTVVPSIGSSAPPTQVTSELALDGDLVGALVALESFPSSWRDNGVQASDLEGNILLPCNRPLDALLAEAHAFVVKGHFSNDQYQNVNQSVWSFEPSVASEVMSEVEDSVASCDRVWTQILESTGSTNELEIIDWYRLDGPADEGFVYRVSANIRSDSAEFSDWTGEDTVIHLRCGGIVSRIAIRLTEGQSSYPGRDFPEVIAAIASEQLQAVVAGLGGTCPNS